MFAGVCAGEQELASHPGRSGSLHCREASGGSGSLRLATWASICCSGNTESKKTKVRKKWKCVCDEKSGSEFDSSVKTGVRT